MRGPRLSYANVVSSLALFVRSALQTASGDVLVRGIIRAGGTAGSVFGGHVPVRVAATRIGSLENR